MTSGLVASPILQLHHPGTRPGLPPTAQMLTFLDRVERRRADRYVTPARAAAFIAGRYLLRVLAADLVDADPGALVSDFGCPTCGRADARPDAPPGARPDHGRPGYLLDGERLPLALSLSRAPGAVLIGALDPRALGPRALDLGAPDRSTTGRGAADLSAMDRRDQEGTTGAGTTGRRCPATAIGVDVDAVGGVLFEGFDDVALSEEERNHVAQLPRREQDGARARLWVRKEALVKARGTGFGPASPSDIEVLADPSITDLEECNGVSLARLGLVAAVAVL